MTTTRTKERDKVDGERIERRGCANDAKNMRPFSWCRLVLVHPFLSCRWSPGEAAAQSPRRGALCVSENVALIGRSVAVMRYQPPANKRINVKMWRWSRRRKKTKGTWEEPRGRRRRLRRRSISLPPNLRRGVERPRGKSAARPTDTMLRLNIRCLNNQARFDLQRRPAKKRRKREESWKGERASKTRIRRKRGNVRPCVCVRVCEKNTRVRDFVGDESEKKNKKKEEAKEKIPVPAKWESNTFSAVPRFRSAPDPLFSSHPDMFTIASCSYTLPALIPRVSLPSRYPDAKCIYVLCKTSNRRWPREPDAHCIINTDALVVCLSCPLL